MVSPDLETLVDRSKSAHVVSYSPAPYFVEEVRQQLEEEGGEDEILGGLRERPGYAGSQVLEWADGLISDLMIVLKPEAEGTSWEAYPRTRIGQVYWDRLEEKIRAFDGGEQAVKTAPVEVSENKINLVLGMKLSAFVFFLHKNVNSALGLSYSPEKFLECFTWRQAITLLPEGERQLAEEVAKFHMKILEKKDKVRIGDDHLACYIDFHVAKVTYRKFHDRVKSK
jgi:hypothetical protein